MMKQEVFFTHKYEMEVPFFDIDMLEIVWHGHYIKYFETARCSMLEALNYNYIDMRNDGYVWPIVDVRAKFIQSAIFGQKLCITCDIVEYEHRLKINYIIKDKVTHKTLTKGYTVQLAVNIKRMEASFITPDVWQQKIKDIQYEKDRNTSS